MTQTQFARLLKEHRGAQGYTQRTLAAKLTDLGVRIDQAAIARMENGRREPKLDEALKISALLGFDLYDLEPESEQAKLDRLESAVSYLMDLVDGLNDSAVRVWEAQQRAAVVLEEVGARVRERYFEQPHSDDREGLRWLLTASVGELLERADAEIYERSGSPPVSDEARQTLSEVVALIFGESDGSAS